MSTIMATPACEENHLGIPKAEFLEDVDSFMSREENNGDASTVIRRLEEMHKKYRFIEMNLQLRKKRLRGQLPDIKGSLEMIKLLKHKQGEDTSLETRFMLSDQVYTKALIAPKTKTVCLWLGANVMLEYSLEEAEDLLTKNLELATQKMSQIEPDLDFLREQITTTEVNMARVVNWDVQKRQMAKKKELTAAN